MSNVEKARGIVASYLGVEAGMITDETPLDGRTIPSSLRRMRLFAAVADAIGARIENHAKIKTFGDLIRVSGEKAEPPSSALPHPFAVDGFTENNPIHKKNECVRIGIDIENVANMPETNDARNDSFYSRCFSDREISYCILHKNYRECFAGKYAAKEAVIKADPSCRDIPMNTIEILNDADGKPYRDGFSISISHTDTTAVAVALRADKLESAHDAPAGPSQDKPAVNFAAILALFISLVALVLVLFTMHR